MNTSIQEGITHQDKGSDVIKEKTIEDGQFKLYNAGVQNSRNDFEANKAFEEIRDSILQKYDIDDLTFEKDFYEFVALLKHHQITLQGDPLDFV